MSTNDPNLNFSGMLGCGLLEQSPLKSQLCSRLAVVSLAVPSTALSHSVKRSAAYIALKHSQVL